MLIKSRGLDKAIPLQKLTELLQELHAQPWDLVAVNMQGNLIILTPDERHTVGHVDLVNETARRGESWAEAGPEGGA